jgi:uncharacterized protein YutD
MQLAATNEVLMPAEKVDETKNESKLKSHVIRRNLEEYMEKKALERRLKDVFDDYDYSLDD